MAKHIEVWYDKTSDASEPAWCVSLCDEDGDEVRCLSTHDDKGDAVVSGADAARKRGMRLYERGTHGTTEEIDA